MLILLLRMHVAVFMGNSLVEISQIFNGQPTIKENVTVFNPQILHDAQYKAKYFAQWLNSLKGAGSSYVEKISEVVESTPTLLDVKKDVMRIFLLVLIVR